MLMLTAGENFDDYQNTTKTSEKLQAETACELHFAIDIFGPPFTIKRGPYATLLSVCLSVCLSSSIGWDR